MDSKAFKAELAARLLCRRRLLPFVQRMNQAYMPGWVHEDICRRLERFSEEVVAGTSPRLMLLLPPRHGKSELASKMFPAWHLGRHPDHEIIACSYNLSLAMKFSRGTKQIIEAPQYQTVFDTRLDPNNSSMEEWGIDGTGGGYVSAGVGGGITGRGCRYLSVDDPIKSAEDADSADYREKLWEWFTSTAYTRLAPGGGVLLIQTLWHDDDLAGRLQLTMSEDPDADQYTVVKYPAFAEEDEFLDLATNDIVRTTPITLNDPPPPNCRLLRRKGEALHPRRYDASKLNRIKKTLPQRFWSALYQQNPVPDDGSYFTRDQFRRAAPPSIQDSHIYIAWDFAISEGKENDYTVGTVGLQDYDDVLHVAEVVRFKSNDSFFIVNAVLAQAKRWYQPSLRLGVEDGQIWRSLESYMKKRMRELKFYPAIEVLKPLTDKLVRARPLQGRMQQGMVSFDDKAEWYETVRNEMLRFPAGLHDDCVDSLAWMTRVAITGEPPRKPRIKELPSWRSRLAQGPMGVSHMAA